LHFTAAPDAPMSRSFRVSGDRHTACSLVEAMSKTPSAATSFGLLGLTLIGVGAVGCSNRICNGIAFEDIPAVFDLSCAPTDLVAVDVSGPCATADASTAPADYVRGTQIGIGSATAGVCHLVLTFATGFTYAADVTFTKTADACGASIVQPTQASFTVDNPTSTCTGGGTDAGSDGG